MKPCLFKAATIVLFAGGFFLNAQNTYSQPAPDENFCVVNAGLVQGDSICKVSAERPLQYNFDDGSAEDYALWVMPGGISAVKFTPPGYPVRLTSGKIYVGDGSFPEGNDFLGTDFQVLVFDDDGPEGFPGTLLDSLTITVENYGWVAFNGLDVFIEGGAFYLGMKQLVAFSEDQFAAPVGIDTDLPTIYNSYIKNPPELSGDWQLSPYQDFMIRAFTCGTDLKLQELNPVGFYGYEIARISDFNPDEGEEPEDGILTLIDAVSFLSYKDTSFYSLSPGFYAYAVRIIRDDSVATGWYYTNVVSSLPSAVGNNIQGRADVRVFPNPATTVFKIESDEIIQSVRLVNALGQTVFIKNPEAKETSIQTGFLNSGFYFVSIKTKQGLINRKIFIGER